MRPSVSLGFPSAMSSLRMFTNFTCRDTALWGRAMGRGYGATLWGGAMGQLWGTVIPPHHGGVASLPAPPAMGQPHTWGAEQEEGAPLPHPTDCWGGAEPGGWKMASIDPN